MFFKQDHYCKSIVAEREGTNVERNREKEKHSIEREYQEREREKEKNCTKERSLS